MPSSGKTTYLWALTENMAREAGKRDRCGWCLGNTMPDFDLWAEEFKRRVEAGDPSNTTETDYREHPLFDAWKHRLGWVPFSIWRYRIRSPEVPGEWIRSICNRKENSAPGFRSFRNLLLKSPALIVMIECAQGANWREAMTKDLVHFQRLMKYLEDENSMYRSVCVVLSKVDSFRALPNDKDIGSSERNIVALPESKSFLGSWAKQGKNPQSVNSEGLVTFRIDEQLVKRKDEPIEQEAIAQDFLRVHVPDCSKLFRNLSEFPNLKVTIMFGSSLGFATEARSPKKLKSESPVNLYLPFSWSLDRLALLRLRAILNRLIVLGTIGLVLAAVGVMVIS